MIEVQLEDEAKEHLEGDKLVEAEEETWIQGNITMDSETTNAMSKATIVKNSDIPKPNVGSRSRMLTLLKNTV